MSDMHRDTNEYMTQLRMKYADDRFQQLNSLLNSTTTAAWTYLLTVNGGAAAGMLAFIGSNESVAAQRWPYFTLAVFVVGLVLVGVAHALLAHKVQGLTNEWIASTGLYWRNELSWSDVIVRDEKAVKRLRALPWVLGWSSLGCFLVGLFLASYGFSSSAASC